MAIKIIIIEDTQVHLNLLRHLLDEYAEKHHTDIEIVGIADNIQDGEKLISTVQHDLIFLDLQLKGEGDGWTLLKSLCEQSKNRKIITMSAFDDKLAKGLNMHERPIFYRHIQKPFIELAPLETLLTEYKKELTFLHKHQSYLYFNVLFMEAEGQYTNVHFTDKSKIMITRNLGKVREEIFTFPFYLKQAGQSFVFNMYRISGLCYTNRYVKFGETNCKLGKEAFTTFLSQYDEFKRLYL